MTTIVISQPMYFPWVGLFEQIRLADQYVHYDDVPFSKGSFVNRVQLKSPAGSRWMTIPLRGRQFGDRIDQLVADDAQPWRQRHLDQLDSSYRTAPYGDEMLDLARTVLLRPCERLVDLLINSIEETCRYLNLATAERFSRSSQLSVAGRSSARVLAIVQHSGGTRYVTGHGARCYLQHEEFEQAGVAVEYMNYRRQAYPQLHGPFNPHVSILDLIANLGPSAGAHITTSPTLAWRDFLSTRRVA